MNRLAPPVIAALLVTAVAAIAGGCGASSTDPGASRPFPSSRLASVPYKNVLETR
jgi:hypothetical protein